MGMTVQEWAKELKVFVDDLDLSRDDYRLINIFIDNGVKRMKEQEPRVMTLEELYDAEYVFFEDNKTGVLCLLPSGDDEYESYFTSRHCDIIQRWKDNYKKSWRCWTSRPTDEQRKATPWEPQKEG